MALSKESIKKLRAVKAAILAEPELYDQNRSPYGKPDCMTPCCIAGWAVWLNNPDPRAYRRKVNTDTGDILLADAVGITEDQAELLFGLWPDGEHGPAWENPTTPEAAAHAADRIELFIESAGTK